MQDIVADHAVAILELTMTLINSTIPDRSAIRIFLVEDSPDVRDLLIENLQEIPGIDYAGFSETENVVAAS